MSKHPVNNTVKINSKDFVHHSKNLFWYVGISMLMLGLLIITISLKDYLLTAVVVVATMAIFRLANLKPGNKKIELSDRGIQWGKDFFAYHDFRAFWIGTHGQEYTIYLERLNFKPAINFIPTDKEVESVLNILACHLPFHAHKNTPIPDRFSRMLRL